MVQSLQSCHPSRTAFDLSELLDVQRAGFNRFLKQGIPDLFSQITPIKIEQDDFIMELVFHGKNYKLSKPENTPRECVLKMKTYSCNLYVEAHIIWKTTSGTIIFSTKNEWVLLGHLPMMTKRGHFIINGSPRVIVHQVVRSPGVYFQQVLDKTEETKRTRYYGDIIPRRGVWLRLQTNKKGKIEAKLKKGKKISATVLYRCLQVIERLESVKSFNKSMAGLIQPLKENLTVSERKALLYVYDKLYRPTEDKEREEMSNKGKNRSRSRSLQNNFLIDKPFKIKKCYRNIYSTFKEKSRYDLSELGREKINTKLNICGTAKQLTALDIKATGEWLQHMTRGKKSVDDIDHLQNRRIHTSGELLQAQFEIGIERLSKLALNKLKEFVQLQSTQSNIQVTEKAFSKWNFSSFLGEAKQSAALRQRKKIQLQPPGENIVSSSYSQKLSNAVSQHKCINIKQYLKILCNKGKKLSLNSEKGQIQPNLLYIDFTNNIWNINETISYFGRSWSKPCLRQKKKFKELSTKSLSLKNNKIERTRLKKNLKNYFFLYNYKFKLKNHNNFDSFFKVFNSEISFTSQNGVQQKQKRKFNNKKIYINRTLGKKIERKLNQRVKKPFGIQLNGVSKAYSSSAPESEKFIHAIKLLTLKDFLSTKPINGALRELFGLNPLSQYMDQTNPLAEMTHKRRMSSLGVGGVSRESAGMAIRGIHPTHYGRICPIETPEGKNAGLVNSLAFYAKINEKGFLETPYFKVVKGQVQQELGLTYRSAKEESRFHLNIAPSDSQQSCNKMLTTDTVPVRVADHLLDVFKKIHSYQVDCIGVSPIQMISVATSLIPFLEHNDANRALMGSNMQRQAVPLMIPERPIVGTGLESLVVTESGHILQSKFTGFISYVSAQKILIDFLSGAGVSSAYAKSSSFYPTSTFVLNRPALKNSSKVLDKAPLTPFIGALSDFTFFCRRAALCFASPSLEKKTQKFFKSRAFVRVELKLNPHVHYQQCICQKGQVYFPFISSQSFSCKKILNLKNKSKKKKNIFILKKSIFEQKTFLTSSSYIPSLKKKSRANVIKSALLKTKASLFTIKYMQSPLSLSWRRIPNKSFQRQDQKSNKKEGLQTLTSKSTRQLPVLQFNYKTIFQFLWLRRNSLKATQTLQSFSHIINNFDRSNQDTCLTQRALVREGSWVQKGDILTDCSASDKGELAVGKNILVAYIPWEGFNFEDAIVISERLVKEHVYTSLHVERYDFNAQDVKEGNEWFTNNLPGVEKQKRKHLLESGLPKIGSFVTEGDILVGKIRYSNKKPTTAYERLLCDILGENNFSAHNSSLYVPKGVHARVIQHNILSYSFENVNPLPAVERTMSPRPPLHPAVVTPTVKRGSRAEQASRTPPKGGGGGATVATPPKSGGGVHPAYPNTVGAQTRIKPQSTQKSYTTESTHTATFGISRAYASSAPGSSDSSLKAKISVGSRGLKGNFIENDKVLTNGVSGAYASSAPYIQRSSTESIRMYAPSLHITEGAGSLRLLKKPRFAENATTSLAKVFTNCSTKKKQNISFVKKTMDKNVSKKVPKLVHVFLAEKRILQVGDKMSGRHGNKGVVAKIVPIQDMPYLPDGTPIDIVLNPLGVPSRMNVGQVLEALLGLAGTYLAQHFKITAFDELYGVEASQSLVFLKLYQARLQSGQVWLFQVDFPGKSRLVDGRSGQCFDQWITVGKAYMLKLIHMVNEKIHARATGPYALITQQPLRGRSQKGGQRLGEMEVWALEGYGAAYTLQELLTKKSDDMVGRKQVASAILPPPVSILDVVQPFNKKGEKNFLLGQPEIFKVLICELQALCLDVGVYSLTTETLQRKFLYKVN